MAGADAEGIALGAAAVAAGLGVDAPVGAALGDAVVEQAAITIASAGTRRAMDRFMTGHSLQAWFGRRVGSYRLGKYLALNHLCQATQL
jgi:hypothetical protein